jgi:hypothetical protein
VYCAHIVIMSTNRTDAPATPLSRLMVFWTNRVKRTKMLCISTEKEVKNVVSTDLGVVDLLYMDYLFLDYLLHLGYPGGVPLCIPHERTISVIFSPKLG